MVYQKTFANALFYWKRQKEEPVTEICSTITESFSFLSAAMFFAFNLDKDRFVFFADNGIWMQMLFIKIFLRNQLIYNKNFIHYGHFKDD